MMIDRLSRDWWAIALRGLVSILFGVVAILLPAPTLVALVLLFGAYALVDGIFAVASGIRRRGEHGPDWFLVIAGIAGIATGVLAAVAPDAVALVLLTLIAAWAILTGVFEVLAAYRLRREIEGEWVLAIDGILAVVFGIILIFQPAAGAIAVVWLIGAWAIISGVMLLTLALRLRSRSDSVSRSRTTAGSAAG
jgi:uncharacterized membrane protein HdeD (DUF308 family)